MKNLIIFSGIIISLFLVQLTSAGVPDIWRECTEANDQPGETYHVQPTGCTSCSYCCFNGITRQWQTSECDITPPTGNISINSGDAYTKTTSVTLTLTCTDASGCSYMKISNDNSTWSTPEVYSTNKTWTLTTGDGTKTVYARFNDTIGNWMATSVSDSIILDTTAPTFTIQYYSDAALTTSLGNNPKLKVGTYYIKITANEALSGVAAISIDAEGTANDFVNGIITLVSGTDYKYTRTIVADAAAIGITLEDISITGTDLAGNTATNSNPTDEATKAAYIDTNPPTITIDSVGDDATQPYTTSDTTPDVIFETNENAWCRMSTSDLSYDSIGASGDCIGEGTTSHTCTSPELAPGSRNLYVACKDTVGNSHTASNNKDISLTVISCTNSFSITSDPSSAVIAGITNIWKVNYADTSPASCPDTITYTVSSLTISGSCDPQTGLYSSTSNPPAGLKLTIPYRFSIARGTTLNNAFKVYIARNGPTSCTLSFTTSGSGISVPKSFTVSSGTSESPYINLFEYSGDTSLFNIKWEVFYPGDPLRTMEVKCGLNCNPETTDCSAIAGKGCSPYPVVHGTEELKKGSCAVSSPAYDFSTTNKVYCSFYDPTRTSLKTVVNRDFVPIDFAVRTTDKITTTVGHRADLKIDVENNGTLRDSYRIDITGSGGIDILPSTFTTNVIPPDQTISVISFITPLVNQLDTITVRVTSLTSGKVVTKSIEVNPGLFALPEFGLVGFIQIIVIAAVVYFLFINRIIKPKKRR